MVSSNTEMLNSVKRTSFIKFDIAVTTFRNLFKMTVLEERLNNTDIEKVC